MDKQQDISLKIQSYLLILVIGLMFSCKTQSTVMNLAAVNKYDSITDFKMSVSPGLVPYYNHREKSALAIDAVQYKDATAGAFMVFNGKAGAYYFILITLGETDGESTYTLLIDEKEVGSVQNKPTIIDYAPQEHKVGPVMISNGSRIEVRFNTHSNGLIPEDGGHAYSRGRWTQLQLANI